MNAKARSDLEKLCNDSAKVGLFTHAFAECGSLAKSAPDFQYGYLPKNESVFDLSSLTKALALTPLIFREVKNSVLKLEDTIEQWMAEAAADFSAPIKKMTVRALLSHQSGLPAWRNFYVCHLGKPQPCECPGCSDESKSWPVSVLNRASANLKFGPKGTYSDLGPILLGLCLERKYGEKIDVIFSRFLQKDLGLEFRLGYSRFIKPAKDFVSTGYCPIRKRHLSGEVHDENCAALGGSTGHSGLFSQADVLGSYIKALVRSPVGELMIKENRKLIGEATSSLVGFRRGDDSSSKPFAFGKAMGHMGFTGTAFWLCSVCDAYALILTNRVISSRKPGEAIKAFRAQGFGFLNDICHHNHR